MFFCLPLEPQPRPLQGSQNRRLTSWGLSSCAGWPPAKAHWEMFLFCCWSQNGGQGNILQNLFSKTLPCDAVVPVAGGPSVWGRHGLQSESQSWTWPVILDRKLQDCWKRRGQRCPHWRERKGQRCPHWREKKDNNVVEPDVLRLVLLEPVVIA